MAERYSKKQRELLLFIDGFIKGNGYGPSYREVMRALGYKSVSTVATHIDGLIEKGYLRKKDHSARSIEVVTLQDAMSPTEGELQPIVKLLEDEIQARLSAPEKNLDEIATLIDAAGVLGSKKVESLRGQLTDQSQP